MKHTYMLIKTEDQPKNRLILRFLYPLHAASDSAAGVGGAAGEGSPLSLLHQRSFPIERHAALFFQKVNAFIVIQVKGGVGVSILVGLHENRLQPGTLRFKSKGRNKPSPVFVSLHHGNPQTLGNAADCFL